MCRGIAEELPFFEKTKEGFTLLIAVVISLILSVFMKRWGNGDIQDITDIQREV